ncbi:hypothetical protein [Aequorivita xiaoshiensis]|uniref:Plasminogen-binding protein PgbA N-terminal domain-containing protein n=1 Tax=Aequorivita xiaoshiensis TaxID=2874476 RepID=A0A9X1U355_9FLAO|nr:hypothetical protein [Aequorivita xiaoshiensis]MCG2430304.1 hypothetical protein [Aequorivita xiaoshiensis]
MKKLFFSICIIFSAALSGQNISNDDVVGVYKEESNDPVGGATFIFLLDYTYVIAYFGGFQKGVWELNKDKVTLIKSTEPQFVLYGRSLKSLKNRTQINFSVEANNAVAVGLDSNEQIKLKPVFNNAANCFNYPYIFKQEKKLHQLRAAQVLIKNTSSFSKNHPSAHVFHFTIPTDYNDLILINLQSDYTQEVTSHAIFNNGKLFIGSDSKGMEKRPLQTLNEEDLVMSNYFAKKSLFPDELTSDNEFFPYFENPSSELLAPFYKIEDFDISKEAFTLESEPYFQASCDDD